MHLAESVRAVCGVGACLFLVPMFVFGQTAEPWDAPYAAGQDANGPHVLGYWRFEKGHELEDSSSRHHTLTLNGASSSSDGKFGFGLECFPATTDVRHSAMAANKPGLSPAGAFSLEMWVKAKPEFKTQPRNVYLVDKKYVSDQDYQLILDSPGTDGGRRWRAVLGFGDRSETWVAEQPLKLEPGVWMHLAVTYDAAGTFQFYVNGTPAGGGFKPGHGPLAVGNRPLSIGDRGGSSYAGFPGFIDEVRLTSGVREFRKIQLVDANRRHVYLRNEPDTQLTYQLINQQRTPLEKVRISVSLPAGKSLDLQPEKLEPGAAYEIAFPLETQLRPDQYTIAVHVTAEDQAGPVTSTQQTNVRLIPRPLPDRMPVVMWGLGGISELPKQFDRLQQIGFTHCLGLRCDYDLVWKAGKPTAPVMPQSLKDADTMLDTALERGVGIIVSLSPGNYLESNPKYQRIDRTGKPYSRKNLANVSPELDQYFYNVGASVANAWGSHPALRAALIDTEIRDGTAPSFHPEEIEAYRKFSGQEIPAEVVTSRGVSWTKIKHFPADRIISENDPLLNYYRWFWKTGDGWNGWHTALHRGFHSADAQRNAGLPLWTFFDPAVRAPSLYGSGGEVDFLSHWTYTYPDPIRIGLCADELLTMAGGSTKTSPQQVMKMTQLIWYRSQTAPVDKKKVSVERSPWEDFDPDAAYITAAPMHVREALWMKLSRPIQGIMYHGWGSLVPGVHSGYRYTQPDTKEELSRLIRTVVEPLGPALKHIPGAPADVALLESFTSQMFAGRGTYGWGSSWAADCWHLLQYAHLQTEILYEETLLARGLDQYRVLVLPDCDVLTEPVAQAIRQFQQRGGIVVGDSRLAPGINADIRIPVYLRQRKADVDQAALIKLAQELRQKLAAKYRPAFDADQSDIIVHHRQAGEATYVFTINDRRMFGDYVGQHGLVMELGRPAESEIIVNQPGGFVYDLQRHREVKTRLQNDHLHWRVRLGPADGGLFLITPRSLSQLVIESSPEGQRGKSLPVHIRIADQQQKTIDAVIPVHIDIIDPNGRQAEFSGHHAAQAGTLLLPLEIASNDTPGIWTIRVQELASGLVKEHFVSIR